jgi:ubiquinone/menaquinone biosynthesis C-methylase UbiE
MTFKNKQNLLHDDTYIPGDYQHLALTKGNIIQRQWHKNRHNLIDYLDFLKEDDRVLDVGCGSGNVIFEFAPKIKEIIGIDNNKECIEYIQRELKEKNIKNVSAIEMNILKLDLKGQNFTRIVMTETIEHFSEKDVITILRNVKEIMAKNAKILITTPNYKSSWVIIEKLIDLFKLSPKLWGEQHLIKFTKERLIKILQGEGFTIEQKGTLNGISPFIAPLNTKLADKISFFEFKNLSFGNLIYVVASLQ